MLWFTADTHFYHKGVIPRNRGFKNVHQMNQQILSNINSVVNEDDTIYFVGDFAWIDDNNMNKLIGLMNQINGNKHLVLGNHDHFKPFDYVEAGFWTVCTALKVEGFYVSHDPSYAEVKKNENWLCGHVHSLFKQQRNVINVGLDVWDMMPVSLTQIQDLLIKR